MNRRSFLALTPGVLASCGEKEHLTVWKGIHMGIECSVSYRGEAEIEPALERVREAEAALTLWDENSPLSVLNRTGNFDNPPGDLLACLAKARELFEASDRLFDPTIHSYLDWATGEYQTGRVPDEAMAAEKRKLVDFSKLKITTERLTLSQGMALSLNAIAQGYLTDVFATTFKASSALVNFGEYRVVGEEPWPVEVAGKTISLKRALAVSSGSGQRLSATAPANHLIHPGTGQSPPPKTTFAVEAPEAWLADGLATLIAVGGSIPSKYMEAKALKLP